MNGLMLHHNNMPCKTRALRNRISIPLTEIIPLKTPLKSLLAFQLFPDLQFGAVTD